MKEQKIQRILEAIPAVVRLTGDTFYHASKLTAAEILKLPPDSPVLLSSYVSITDLLTALRAPCTDDVLDNYDSDGAAPEQQKPETD
jgi:hypothetical protein